MSTLVRHGRIRLWRRKLLHMFATYVIYSEKLKKRYVGSSMHPANRLIEHNKGKSKYTSRGIPWFLKYIEYYPTRTEAMSRERYLKTGSGRYFLDRLFEGAEGYPETELPDNCREYRYF